MLARLSESSGNILDDSALIETIQKTQETSRQIKSRLARAAALLEAVEAARAVYFPVAARASKIYFLIQRMQLLEHCYASDLESFTAVYAEAVSNTHDPPNRLLQQQLQLQSDLQRQRASLAQLLAEEGADSASQQTRLQRQREEQQSSLLQLLQAQQTPQQQSEQQERIAALVEAVTAAVFERAAVSLFGPHKLPFAFAVAAQVYVEQTLGEGAEVLPPPPPTTATPRRSETLPPSQTLRFSGAGAGFSGSCAFRERHRGPACQSGGSGRYAGVLVSSGSERVALLKRRAFHSAGSGSPRA